MSGDLMNRAPRATAIGGSVANAMAGVTLTTAPSNVHAYDAFGRLRVAEPLNVFSGAQVVDALPLLFSGAQAGTGATSHVANQSHSTLTVGPSAGSGDFQLRQSRYIPYVPAHAQEMHLTYSADWADNARVVVRTSTSGTPDDTAAIERASWDDPLDGSGPSGLTLDLSQRTILVVDLQWLAVGSIRLGVNHEDVTYWFLTRHHSGSGSIPYMRSATLPVRYEIRMLDATTCAIRLGLFDTNDGPFLEFRKTVGAGDTPTLRQICASVVSSGASDILGVSRVAFNTSLVAVTTRRPLLSYRGTSPYIPLRPSSGDCFSSAQPILCELVANATLTTPSWASGGGNAHFEVDTAATGISGGEVIGGFVVAAASSGGGGGAAKTPGAGGKDVRSQTWLSRLANGNFETLTLAARSLNGSTTDCAGTLGFLEVY